jgi:putative holliday junction resolvase
VDYGEKNIGLACCDALGLTVQPLPSIPNSGRKKFLHQLKSMIGPMGVEAMVLGMPVNMDGSCGDAAQRMQKLLSDLQNALQIPLAGVDERLSTVEAMEYWNKMSARQKKKYRTVDSLAAALILERYLREYKL